MMCFTLSTLLFNALVLSAVLRPACICLEGEDLEEELKIEDGTFFRI